MNFAIVRGLLFVGLTGCNYITSTLGKSIRMNNSGLLTGNYVSAIGDTKLVIIYCGRSEKSSFFFYFRNIRPDRIFLFFFSELQRQKAFRSEILYCKSTFRSRPRLLFYISITPCFALNSIQIPSSRTVIYRMAISNCAHGKRKQ